MGDCSRTEIGSQNNKTGYNSSSPAELFELIPVSSNGNTHISEINSYTTAFTNGSMYPAVGRKGSDRIIPIALAQTMEEMCFGRSLSNR